MRAETRQFRSLLRLCVVAITAGVLALGGTIPAMAVTPTLDVCADCEHKTIQSALDVATAGDTVQVAAGVYAEELAISTAGISLIGAGQDATTIVPSRNYASNNRGISIFDASNLLFKDLTVDGGGNDSLAAGENFHDGIWWNGGGDNVTIENVTVRNIDRRGISVYPETVVDTLISGVTVENVSGAATGAYNGQGILMHGAGTIENTRVHAAKYGIGGNNAAPAMAPVIVRNSSVSGLTGIDAGMFNIGINFWIKNDGKVTITGNSIAGSAERNGGVYLVDPGADSTISDNTIALGGTRGLGIELIWASSNGIDITDNTITMADKSTGILATGSGTSADPVLISDNVIRNSSTAGPVENNYSNWGPYQQREVGIIVSAEPATSRSADTMSSTYATVTGNVVSGYTNAIAYVEDIDGAYDLTVTSTGNDFRATGAAAVHGVIDGPAKEAASFTPIAADSVNFAAINAEDNYWGNNTPDFGALLVGSIDATPWVTYAVSTTSTVTVSPSGSAIAGTTVTLTGTVSPSTAAGTVEIFDGTTSLGEGTATDGVFTVETSALAVGDHSLTVTFTPANVGNFQASASAAVTFSVNEKELPAELPAANTDRLQEIIETQGLDVPGTTDSFVPSGDTTGNALDSLDVSKTFSGTLPWSDGADSFVDVYAYSSPVFLGTFPVVNGKVQITGVDLSALQAGGHHLVFVGQTSETVSVMAVTVVAPEVAAVVPASSSSVLAVTGVDPAVPIGAASSLLLLGLGLLIVAARRRRA